ncbi:hypothetical protein, partial [Tritonibacter sp. SIMBA_163]|uniref:hypothetical protein n=1 Tax=Tritonibacter sp. SIMBA_163 TaxID=3080868 RepID=UPI003980ADA8
AEKFQKIVLPTKHDEFTDRAFVVLHEKNQMVGIFFFSFGCMNYIGTMIPYHNAKNLLERMDGTKA